MTQARSENIPIMFVAGVVIGSVMTALFTPSSGKEMRNTIKSRIDTIKDDTKEAAEKVGNEVDEKLEVAKDTAEKVQNKIRGQSNDKT